MPVSTKKSPDLSRQSTLDSREVRYAKNKTGIKKFQQMVLRHYEDAGRRMAWRDTTEPYLILVSEIMLQQTQVERVTTKFPEFIARFPDFISLANAPLAEVLGAWQGMGYNRRAIALQKCAQRVVSQYDGILPSDVETLATFPGIGMATASSIAAFAFNEPVIFIETNIRRVFIHFFFADAVTVTDAEILPLVEKALFRENPRIWYWALMDLGTVLKKTVPNPNRRSAHYTRQAPFEGSDRKIRGMILKLLVAGPGRGQKEIEEHISGDPDRVERILASLERDGFIERKGTLLTIAGRSGNPA